ncbi:Hypothetical predicted protein [Podarcis lilfordi]|uniref:Uncharacterized protein n=1 Tax=Podarcis lilfordi TaxID=74358 RepID=A0AA35K593_9SAUR|nr:Hypothetical predicted protein [Podarcis lilfordi]
MWPFVSLHDKLRNRKKHGEAWREEDKKPVWRLTYCAENHEMCGIGYEVTSVSNENEKFVVSNICCGNFDFCNRDMKAI